MAKIEPLKDCKRLSVLYLQEFNFKTGRNPICEGNESYRIQIFSTVPQLARLDGHPKALKAFDDEAVYEIENAPSGPPEYNSDEQWFSSELKGPHLAVGSSNPDFGELKAILSDATKATERVGSVYDLI